MEDADFVTSYIDAWNEHDPAGVVGHLALGGIYCDIPAQRQLQRAELIKHLEDYFDSDSSVFTLVGEVLTSDNAIAFQYKACPRGKKSGPCWMGAEFITMEGHTAGLIEDYYRDPTPIACSGRGDGSGQRYAKSGLNRSDLKMIMTRLSDAMESDQAYLDSHLSLPELATRLGCSINHLSQAINEGHRVSFFDFINRYRVREATAVLMQDANKTPSILDVALAVGFNSTSTFYAAFKKSTGKTPAQFRREWLQQR